MKRRLLIIAVFLLVGAVVNVAVAWGFAAWVDPTKVAVPDIGFRATGDYTWRLGRSARPGVTILLSARGWRTEPLDTPDYGPAPETLTPFWSDLATATTEFRTLVESRPAKPIHESRTVRCAGWPLRSLCCDWYQVRLGSSPTSFGACGCIWLGSFTPWLGLIRVLPLRPIWPGFAVNTIFYAALLWLLIPGPFALRRFLRLRRRLCPKCAYPIGESAVCTECGITLPRRRMADPK